MATKIRSISLTEEEDKLISKLELSPTHLIKSKLAEIKATLQFTREEFKEMERGMNVWKANFRKAEKFIESKGFWAEFQGIEDVLEQKA